MPNGQRESYEAVPRRPELQGTEGPALSMALCSLFICYHVSNIPCPSLKHTLPLSQTSVTPRTCSSVTLSFSYPVSISALCYSQNLFICYPVSYYKQLVHPSTRPPVNLPRYPVSTIPCPYLRPLLLPELVHLLLCLSHTQSSYPPYPVSLSTLPCPYPVTKKVKPYSFTFFFFPLLSLLMRSRAVITKTYFVCPP